MILNVNQISPILFSAFPTQKRKEGNQGTRETQYYYKDVVCAFDIETTRLKIGEKRISKTVKKDVEVSIMYIWQFQVGTDITIIGRTWEEFKTLMQYIKTALKDNEKLVCYIHNASYEFQFLRDENVLGKEIDEKSVFLLSPRKILKFDALDGKINFRCSYIHSNMNLADWTDKLKVKHGKLSGKEFNYDKLRFPWTPLSDKEMQYCCNDVIGLVECIYKEMEIDGDNLYTIPLTSTGYVRRDIRKAVRDLPRGWVTERKPDYETYRMLHNAFRGGNTHANRYDVNTIKNEHICEYDRSSSYPDVQLNGLFPIEKFSKPRETTKELFNLAIERNYAVIADIQFFRYKNKERGDSSIYI